MKHTTFMARVALAATLLTILVVGTSWAQTPRPEFKLGFKALAEQIPEVVGTALENEHWGANGDSLQQTSKGLMVWRKVDNWTAFTNGSRTWINGPFGVAERPNDERFDWERDPRTVAPSASGQVDQVASLRSALGPGQRISDFPGPVLLPSAIPGIEGTRPISRASVSPQQYEVTLGGVSNGTITLSGTVGRKVMPGSIFGCSVASSYCAESTYVSGPPNSEIFRGLIVGSYPAEVVHGTCCNGENWSIGWYDAKANVTYYLLLYLDPAQALGARGITAANFPIAQQLAEAASSFVTVPPFVAHPTEGMGNCLSCHQVGGPGTGAAGGTGMKPSHSLHSNASCQGCHKPL